MPVAVGPVPVGASRDRYRLVPTGADRNRGEISRNAVNSSILMKEKILKWDCNECKILTKVDKSKSAKIEVV